MVARVVTLLFEDGRWFADAREWLEERLSASGPPRAVHAHWLFDPWQAKVVSVALYADEEALRASDAHVRATLDEIARRFPPVSSTVETSHVLASR